MSSPTAALDLISILAGVPRGAWVAISAGEKRVIAQGFDMQKVIEEAKNKGEDKPIITRVPELATALML